jgi:hypothetical protein
MSIALCTLALNEMEWLPLLWEQHRGWPGLAHWVFVEAADEMYARANPDLVTSSGLSVDGTTEYLGRLAREHPDLVSHIPLGFSRHSNDRAQGKCEARQASLDAIAPHSPRLFVTLDADEFWTQADQARITRLPNDQFKGYTYRYRNIWYPPSLQDRAPLLGLEVVGGFWRVLVCKVWRWSPHVCYRGNHNSPQEGSLLLNRRLKRLDKAAETPEFVHMGFASREQTRLAKNAYYVERGEGRTDHRGSYVVSRAAFAHWQPGDALPNGDRVIPYIGPVPEVFQPTP